MNPRQILSVLKAFHIGLWPCLLAQAFVGVVITVGRSDAVLHADDALEGVAAALVWVIGLGGACAAACEVFRPETDSDPTIPPGQRLVPGWIALGLLLAGLVLAPVISWRLFDLYLAGIVLVVVYSVPPMRLRRWVVTASLLEALGAGALTFYAGLVALDLPARAGAPWPLYGLGCMFMVWTLRVLSSPNDSVLDVVLYFGCIANAFVCLGWAGRIDGLEWSLALLSPPLLGWVVMGLHRYAGGAAAGERVRPGSLVLLCLLTQAAVAAAYLVRIG